MFDAEPAPSPERKYQISPAYELKMTLFREGIVPDKDAREALAGADGKVKTTADYRTTSGIILNVLDGFYINTPHPDESPFAKTSPNTLHFTGKDYQIQMGDGRVIEAKRVTPPEYMDRKNKNGVRYGNMVATHTDRARISPIMGCDLNCQFCNVPYERMGYIKWDAESLVDAVKVALDDPVLPAKHLLISGGTPKHEDFEHLQDVYSKIRQAFPGLEIDIMMTPAIREDGTELLNLKMLKDVLKINALSINLELFSQDAARRYMALKSAIGQDRFFKFLDQAVNVFGPGKVRSMLITGIEPVEETIKGIEALAQIGVSPEMSTHRPEPNSLTLGSMLPPSVEDQERIDYVLHDIIEKYNPQFDGKLTDGLQCGPCMHNSNQQPTQKSYMTEYDKETKTTSHIPYSSTDLARLHGPLT